MIRILVVQRADVRADDGVGLCLHPLAQDIAKAWLSTGEAATTSRVRSDLSARRIVGDAVAAIGARHRRGAFIAMRRTGDTHVLQTGSAWFGHAPPSLGLDYAPSGLPLPSVPSWG